MHPSRSIFDCLTSVALGIALCTLGLACDSTTGSSGHESTGGNARGGSPGGGGGTVGGTTGGGSSSSGSGSGGFALGGTLGTGGSASGGAWGGGGSAAGGMLGTGGSSPSGGGSMVDAGPRPTGGAAGNATGVGGRGDGGSASGGGAGGAGGRSANSGGLGGGGGITGGGGGAHSGGVVAAGGIAATGGSTSTGGKTGSGGSAGAGGGVGGSTAGSTLCPPGITKTITVAKDGSGSFTTMKAAIDSLSGTTEHVRIDIKAGTYTEKLTISSPKNLCLVGASNTTTILSYGDSNGSVGSTSGSASVHISADDFSAANLAIQNTYGSGSQAVALRVTGDRQQFLNCRFIGYQDTLYTHNGMQYFRNCYVQGNTDYVFGGATAVLQDCEARNVEGGSAVAAPNTDIGTAYGIVFLGGQFTAVSSVKSGSVALGRPWGADGFAAFLKVNLGSHISSAGFVTMSSNPPQNARFHEYQSTGSGANTSARSSYQLSSSDAAKYTLATILGGWTPSYSQ
jgi:pectin methylesterase-like acyl-CoA thioesterase